MSVKRRPGRPRMTRKDYLLKYSKAIFELRYLEMSLRSIARDCKVSLSTVVRLKSKFL